MDELLRLSLFGTDQELIELIRSGINIDFQDKAKRTPLIHVAIENRIDKMEILIENGANVNIQDYVGYSALHYAAQNSSYSACKLLLEHGAAIDLQDIHGNTPLSRAIFNSKGRGETICLLRDFGADIQKENKYGVSPFQLAKSISNFDVLIYLV